jgi:hypothetical protein
VLVVVADEVLGRGLDAGALDAAAQGCRAQAGEHGVLADGLEAAASQGRALHVDGWAQDAVGALELGLIAHLAACLLEERLVEGGAQGRAAGEAGRLDAIEELCAAHAVGAVRQTDGRDAMLGKRLGVPKVDTFNKSVSAD